MNLTIFNKNLEEIGDLEKNLVLRTKGRVYIRYGRKYIDLLNDKGELNVKIPKILKKVDSLEGIKEDGFYLYEGNLYAYYEGDLYQITGEEGDYISFAVDLKLNQEQINIASKNIGLKFNSLREAKNTILKGIVFIDDKIYYINGSTVKYLGLNLPLLGINEANLLSTPTIDNSCIAYSNGHWSYLLVLTRDDVVEIVNNYYSSRNESDLNSPLYDINIANLEDDPEVDEKTYITSDYLNEDVTYNEETKTVSPELITYNEENKVIPPLAIVYLNIPIVEEEESQQEPSSEDEEEEAGWEYLPILSYVEFDEFKNFSLVFKKWTELMFRKMQDCCNEVWEEITNINELITNINEQLNLFDNRITILEQCCEDMHDASTPRTVTFYWSECDMNNNGSKIRTEQVSRGATPTGPSSNPLTYSDVGGTLLYPGTCLQNPIHKIFNGWNADWQNASIQSDTNYFATWIDAEPSVTLEADTYNVPSTGGTVVLTYYASYGWEAINTSIPLSGQYNDIDFTHSEAVYNNGKFTRTLTVLPNTSGIIGKITITATFGTATASITISQVPNGVIALPEFDLMKFSMVWEQTDTAALTNIASDSEVISERNSDLDQLVYIRGSNISEAEEKACGYGAGLRNVTSRYDEIIVHKDYTEVKESGRDQFEINLYASYMTWSGDNLGPGGEYTVINFGKLINDVINLRNSGTMTDEQKRNQKAVFVYYKVLWYAFNGTGYFGISYNLYNANNGGLLCVDRGGFLDHKFDFELFGNAVEVPTSNNILPNLYTNRVNDLYSWNWPANLVTDIGTHRAGDVFKDRYTGNTLVLNGQSAYERDSVGGSVSDTQYGQPIATLVYDIATGNITFYAGYITQEDLYGETTSGTNFTWN